MNEQARAYYNEIDPYAAQWLRNLITAGHIAPGDVDERSIEDVHPDDLRTYTQCHFFAGIGVWSYALRRASWPDDRPVWTGSCPCQPFSEAGKGAGFNDERHLWPHWHWLIQECRPSVILGEQVASKNAEPWVDLVQADMENLDYAIGAIPFPSASVGAPHIRDRAYWVALTNQGKWGWGAPDGRSQRNRAPSGREQDSSDASWRGEVHGMANTHQQRRDGCGNERKGGREQYPDGGSVERLADAHDDKQRQGRRPGSEDQARPESGPESGRRSITDGLGLRSRPGPVNGPWADADWIFCRDGKWRPVEPGTQPLVDGAPARVGRLRAYGNAINAYQAQIFIETVMEASQ